LRSNYVQAALDKFSCVLYCPINGSFWDSTMDGTAENRSKTPPTGSQTGSENGTVGAGHPPKRQRNDAVRTREYLTEPEVQQLIKAAGSNFYGHRDAAMILLCFRHALRVSELCELEWRDVLDLDKEARASLNVRRVKGSVSGAHPLEPDEVKALRKLRRDSPEAVHVFTSERGGKLTSAAFRKMLTRLADKAGLAELHVHPHMLRHATGHALAQDAQVTTRELSELMGHANLNNTRRYTALNAERFRGIWRRHK
jgi:integrase